MFWTFYGPKGGVGVSTVAAAVAARAASTRRVLVVDLDGDLPDLFGIAPPDTPGVGDWLGGDPSVGPEALLDLAVPIADRLTLLPVGGGVGSSSTPLAPDRASLLVDAAADAADLVIADVGRVDAAPFGWPQLFATASHRRTLVVRACYLALRRAAASPVDPDDIVELVEGGRALRTIDIEGVLQRPVDATVPVEPRIARAVDAGLLVDRCPRPLRRLADALLADSMEAAA